VSAAPTDEIYDRYLKKAISEINELGDEIAHAAAPSAPVLGSGHPLADVFMLKYRPQAAEAQEGVAFFGRSGQAILRALQRLRVDPLAVYGTNCLKFATAKPDDQARAWLARELHIVQPKLVVVMGEEATAFLNGVEFPLADPLEPTVGELQRFTPTVEALVCPDIDASLDEQSAKTRFWGAFKRLGPWWSELPPY